MQISESLAPYRSHLETVLGPLFQLHADPSEKDMASPVHVLHFAPSPNLNFHTLVTYGIGFAPGKENKPGNKIELVICLPPEWPFAGEELNNFEHSWPLDVLNEIGHHHNRAGSLPKFGDLYFNGDPLKVYTGAKGYCACLLSSLSILEGILPSYAGKNGPNVDFLAVIPLYFEELEGATSGEIQDLTTHLTEHGVTELLLSERINTGVAMRG